MTTGSKMVLEHLKALPQDAEFSRLSIARALPEVGEGSISGFLSKLKAQGRIKLSSRKPSVNGYGSLEHYTIAESLDDVPTRNSPNARGGITGRTMAKVHTNRQRLVETLMTVASDIERMQVGLSDYTTKELLKEIERRTIAAEDGQTQA